MTRTSHVFFAMPWPMHETRVAAQLSRFASDAVPGRARVMPGRCARSALVFALSFSFGLLACQAEGPSRPDLVLITIDALSADRLACFGGDPDAGGSLCALGEGGTLFAWAASPGRGEASTAATVLTGLPARDHRLTDRGQSFLTNEQTTIAERLSQAGYRTAAFVASARLNRSRRLDQGFDYYDDALARPGHERAGETIEMANRVQNWITSTPSPRFVWIHADRASGLVELDRLLARLAQSLEPETGRAGVLFVALRGEDLAERDSTLAATATISWSTHRIPLVWRPPTALNASVPGISYRLASLVDIVPTLLAAAHAMPEPSTEVGEAAFRGRDLTRLAQLQPSDSELEERFVFLDTDTAAGEVGLASETHLYVRRRSVLDGSGNPVPTTELVSQGARFSTLPIEDGLRPPAPRSAALEPAPWRRDVLDAESPVPRLEFHLARRLGIPIPVTQPATLPAAQPATQPPSEDPQ